MKDELATTYHRRMPEPLRGLVAVGEYGSRYEADAAVARLRSGGIDATASNDPALTSVVDFMASDRTVEVLVRQADAEQARAVLAEEGGLPPEFTEPWVPERRGRNLRKRVLLAGLIIWLLGPAILVALIGIFVR
jgi:hypothetical protein